MCRKCIVGETWHWQGPILDFGVEGDVLIRVSQVATISVGFIVGLVGSAQESRRHGVGQVGVQGVDAGGLPEELPLGLGHLVQAWGHLRCGGHQPVKILVIVWT